MRLHRFYIYKKIDNENLIVDDLGLIHQWRNVFRYNTGSEVILFDGSSFEYDYVIKKLTNRDAEISVVSKREGIIPKKRIILYQSLIKKDKMEWVVEKATELGVSKIVPIISERSEKKDLNMERIRKIIVEASEQCGRADVPVLGSVMTLEECIMEVEEEKIVFDITGEHFSSSLIHNTCPVSIFIGPEGGWTEKELELFKQKGAKIFSLGPLTLRAETASIVALTTSKLLG